MTVAARSVGPDALTPQVLRRAYATFPTGVVAVCGIVDGRPIGLAASSFNTLSLEPPLVGVAFGRASTTWPLLRTAERLGVSVLAEDQGGLCRRLAGPPAERFAAGTWWSGPRSEVHLAGSCLTLSCSIDSVVPVGDHDLAVLAVHGVGTPRGEPLVFHASDLRRLTPRAAA